MAYQIGPKVNIRNINDIYEELLAQFEGSDHVVIDLDAAEDCDLSMIQLIESARRHGSDTGRDVILAKPANASVAALLARAGFLEGFSAADSKFWLHKEVM
jgi:anti-anti-sigma regulatory factor